MNSGVVALNNRLSQLDIVRANDDPKQKLIKPLTENNRWLFLETSMFPFKYVC